MPSMAGPGDEPGEFGDRHLVLVERERRHAVASGDAHRAWRMRLAGGRRGRDRHSRNQGGEERVPSPRKGIQKPNTASS